jgi:hypothetical protein
VGDYELVNKPRVIREIDTQVAWGLLVRKQLQEICTIPISKAEKIISKDVIAKMTTKKSIDVWKVIDKRIPFEVKS